ncbi:MAG: HAMP domain-containing histidine kinase [Bacteroidales bacterium]|nr:HAMP domain-containing histidine kinase [Bacteroidales bacterium]
MAKGRKQIMRLHWRLYFPLVAMLWLIIGITIFYFVSHEKNRQQQNLENRLLNVNNTVIEAYNNGVNLQETVNFIRLFTDNTTLTPLRITVYDKYGTMVADNPATTINLYEADGTPNPALADLLAQDKDNNIQNIIHDEDKSMICCKASPDGMIYSLSALPYEGEVVTFLSTDPMIWIVVLVLGVLTSVMAYFGVRAICRSVYTLRDFADNIASDHLPDNIDTWHFSRDELGDVSRNLLTLYRDKIRAEQSKIDHERLVSRNISHELKTPVGIIKGYIDTIIADPDMPESVKDDFLARIQQNTDRLASLITDVSMVMRLSEQELAGHLSVIDFHYLAVTLAEDIVNGHVADGIAFSYDIPEPCFVVAHESLLINALLNLAYNTARHSGATQMKLAYEGLHDGLSTFTFTDNGNGVAEEHIGRLFELFYRVDKGRTRKNGGSGLGLPLVRKIITSMGGTITVENVPTGGLRFTFTIPAAQE